MLFPFKNFVFFFSSKFNLLDFSIMWSADKKIRGCLSGMSFIKLEERIAGPVFFFEGSNIILYLLILCIFNSSFFNRTVSSIILSRFIFLKSGSWGRIAFRKCAIIPSSLSTSFIQADKDLSVFLFLGFCVDKFCL